MPEPVADKKRERELEREGSVSEESAIWPKGKANRRAHCNGDRDVAGDGVHSSVDCVAFGISDKFIA